MKLLDLPPERAVGSRLAHGHRLPNGALLKKGHVLTAADAHALVGAGELTVSAVVFDSADVDENEAAHRIAIAVAGPNVRVADAATGRANLFATARGVLVFDRARIDALNAIDESVTVATLPPHAVVDMGAMVATVKIIPFAVPRDLLARATELGDSLAGMKVAPFAAKKAGMVLTTLPHVKESVLERGRESQRQRMAFVGGSITRELTVDHHTGAITNAIAELLAARVDILLILGASAIVDRDDVVPTAIRNAGGEILHFGMPVDPGNLLLLARIGDTPVIGVPGCARSTKASGFDWVLERIAANLDVTREDITKMGVGGLLAEVAARPCLRLPAEGIPGDRERAENPAQRHPIAAVVLAAGLSRRMEGVNKLTAEVGGEAIVARVVDALLASKATTVIVVVGHEAQAVRAALGGRAVRFVTNPDYEEGLGASLRTGIAAVPNEMKGALVALGDMPWIRPAHVDALIDAFDPESEESICVPVHDRKRGHPVLWSARHFAEMKRLGGDTGARVLLEKYADAVKTVAVDDAAVHLDVDTLDMLARARRE